MNEIVPLDHDGIVAMFKRDYISRRLPGDFMHTLVSGNIPIQGHKGDINGTFHEWLFSLMFPTLEKQVSFGTGKGGMKKWLCKCYTVDFLDKKEKYIYEIDGKGHDHGIHNLKDQIRDYFFSEKGYKVIRVTNKDVENLLVKRFRRAYGGITSGQQ